MKRSLAHVSLFSSFDFLPHLQTLFDFFPKPMGGGGNSIMYRPVMIIEMMMMISDDVSDDDDNDEDGQTLGSMI